MPAEPAGPGEGQGACHRPLPRSGRLRPAGAVPLAGGPLWFTEAVRHEAGRAPVLVRAAEIPAAELARITAPRAPVCGLGLDRPRIMAILNVTPDSFSDGGRHLDPGRAVAAAEALAAEGADILDIGGESTRPGHRPVDADTELARVAPVLQALAGRVEVPISIDTTKREVAAAALRHGACIVNDVWGLKREPALASLAAEHGADLVLMHNREAADPSIDIVDDVVRFLEGSIAIARAAGVPDANIVLDPGMGFGKTPAQSLEVVRRLDAVRALGFRVLLGVSRKRTIGLITGREVGERVHGTVAMNVFAMLDGVDIIRVHDVKAHLDARRIVEALGALPGSAPMASER